jgi:hypothetical protein
MENVPVEERIRKANEIYDGIIYLAMEDIKRNLEIIKEIKRMKESLEIVGE